MPISGVCLLYWWGIRWWFKGGVKWSFFLVSACHDVTLWCSDSSAFLFAFTKFWLRSETPSSLWLLIAVSILWHPNTCYEMYASMRFFDFYAFEITEDRWITFCVLQHNTWPTVCYVTFPSRCELKHFVKSIIWKLTSDWFSSFLGRHW